MVRNFNRKYQVFQRDANVISLNIKVSKVSSSLSRGNGLEEKVYNIAHIHVIIFHNRNQFMIK